MTDQFCPTEAACSISRRMRQGYRIWFFHAFRSSSRTARMSEPIRDPGIPASEIFVAAGKSRRRATWVPALAPWRRSAGMTIERPCRSNAIALPTRAPQGGGERCGPAAPNRAAESSQGLARERRRSRSEDLRLDRLLGLRDDLLRRGV